MYTPLHYSNQDLDSTIAFMKRFNFATVITSINNVPEATHLPFVVTEKEGKVLLTSHFAKANLHWKAIEVNENLVVFTEPHAYVSPDHYERKENVPTWNYVAVHAYGKARLITDQEEGFGILEKMMDSFEPAYKTQWKSLPDDFKQRMFKGIVAFEIEVSRLQAKEKLSQNKQEAERQSIISAFEQSNRQNEQFIAEYMKKNEEKNN